jgi:hypothetical protein
MTEPDIETLIANSAGRVVGTHTVETAVETVATKVGPLRALNLAARGNLAMIGASVVVAAFIAMLELFDEDKVNRSIQDWRRAELFLVNQDGSFDQAFPRTIADHLPPAAWTATDRDEFNAFVTHFTNEVVAISTALGLNADALQDVKDAFHQAVDALIIALVPALLAAIASIAMQFFPPTAPAAEAIGIAAAVLAIGEVAVVATYLVNALGAIGASINANKAGHFTSVSRPGDVPPGAKDPDLKDISITWVHDPAYYKKGQ